MEILPVIKRLLALFVALLTLVLSVQIMAPYAIGASGSGYTGLDSYPYGTPSRPMVYRMLMPAVIKTILHAIPESVEKQATSRLIEWRESEQGKAARALFIHKPPLEDGQIFETAVVMVVCWLTVVMFLFMFYILARAVWPESTAYALLAPVLAMQLLPVFLVNNAYIYDFAELFFSCLLSYYMLKGRWRAYLIAFAIATINKETTLFMIVFFATWSVLSSRRMAGSGITRGSEDNNTAADAALPDPVMRRDDSWGIVLLIQIVLYVAIKAALTLYFADYPGKLIGPDVSLTGNLHYLWQWGDYKFVLFAWLLMAYRWKEKPVFLKASVPMLLVHWAVYLVICIPGEYRDLFWSLPIMLLMITHSLVAGVDVAGHPLFRTNPAAIRKDGAQDL